jgi:hypothetical protein
MIRFMPKVTWAENSPAKNYPYNVQKCLSKELSGEELSLTLQAKNSPGEELSKEEFPEEKNFPGGELFTNIFWVKNSCEICFFE